MSSSGQTAFQSQLSCQLESAVNEWAKILPGRLGFLSDSAGALGGKSKQNRNPKIVKPHTTNNLCLGFELAYQHGLGFPQGTK